MASKADTIDEILVKLVDDITIAGYGKKDHPNLLIKHRDKQPFAGYKFSQDKAKAALSAMVAESLEYQVDTTIVADGAWDVPGEQEELLYISKDNVIRNLQKKGFTL